MTAQARLSLATGEPLGTPRRSPGAHLGALRSHLAAWVGTCADYYQAAALYGELSGLSDAELQRRGLSRATLARDVCDACGSTAER
jgi:hypothetical protein